MIPPPSWAFQVENFRPPPNDELVCSICQCVFCMPVECPCRHVFCAACIGKWITIHRTCPICRKRTGMTSLRAVNRIIKNLIMGLTLRCKNYNYGCEPLITLESTVAHMKICDYEVQDCPNSCGLVILRKDMAQHNLEECPLRSITCGTCGMSIKGLSCLHNCVESLQLALKEKDKEISRLLEEVKRLKEGMDGRNNATEREVFLVEPLVTDMDYDIDLWSSCTSRSASSSLGLTAGMPSVSITTTSSSDSDSPIYESRSLSPDAPTSYRNPDSTQHEDNADGYGDVMLGDMFSEEGSSTTSLVVSDDNSSGRCLGLNRRLRLRGPYSRRLRPVERPRSYTGAPVASMDEPSQPSTSHNNLINHPSSLGGLLIIKNRLSEDHNPVPPVQAEASSSATDAVAATGASVEALEQNKEAAVSIFRRTLSLLQQHNSDSDPDYVPCGSDSNSGSWPNVETSSDTDSRDEYSFHLSPDGGDSDHEQINLVSDEDSNSSYEVQVPTPTYDLLERYGNRDSRAEQGCDYDSDTDPDWSP